MKVLFILSIALLSLSVNSQVMELEKLAYANINKDGERFMVDNISINEKKVTIEKEGCYNFYIQSSSDLIVRYNEDTIFNQKISEFEGQAVLLHFSWIKTNNQKEVKSLKKGDIISWSSFDKVSINQVAQAYKSFNYENTQYEKGYKYYRFQGTKKEYWELLEWVEVGEGMFRWKALCDGVQCWTDDYWIAEGNAMF